MLVDRKESGVGFRVIASRERPDYMDQMRPAFHEAPSFLAVHSEELSAL